MTIYFYGSKGKPYGCFSNFSPHGFELDDAWWPTSEHYFQAQKFAGTPYAKEIRQARTASEAAKMGRRRSHPLRSDWEQVKDQVMLQGVLRKFETHADIRSILQNFRLESPRDSIWGMKNRSFIGGMGGRENRTPLLKTLFYERVST